MIYPITVCGRGGGVNNEIVTSVSLGSGGAGAKNLVDGWSLPEPQGTWSIGTVSKMLLGQLATGADHIVELTARPFVNRPFVKHQTIRATIGGIAIADIQIDSPGILGLRIPAALLAEGVPVILTLHHRFAARPCDSLVTRDNRWIAVQYERLRVFRMEHDPSWSEAGAAHRPFLTPAPASPPSATAPPNSSLAQSIERRLGLTPAQLLTRFESVGDNCEFGLVQRRGGAEPLGLLRFSATPLPKLLRGLENGFEGLGAPEAIEPQLHGTRHPREYMIREHAYELVYHTFHYENEFTPDAIRRQEARRLSFLRRKFLEDLELGAKILVCKRQPTLSEAEVLPLLAALGQRGPNTLLWVTEADAGHEPGSVEIVTDRLMKAYIDRFAPGENAHELSLDCWLQICANAYSIWPERHRAEN
jgi:hypothetical protein